MPILLIQVIDSEGPVDVTEHPGIYVQCHIDANRIIDATVGLRPTNNALQRLLLDTITPALYTIGDYQARTRRKTS